jgi:hypothetical protein
VVRRSLLVAVYNAYYPCTQRSAWRTRASIGWVVAAVLNCNAQRLV